MKKLSAVWLNVLTILFFLSSCTVVGGIFKAGVWVGIIIVVFVVVLILWLVNRGRS